MLDYAFDDYWHEHMSYYYKIATWQSKRPLLPRRCNLTGRILWWRHAMVGTRIITGPGSPITEKYWVDPNELMLHKIKYGY